MVVAHQAIGIIVDLALFVLPVWVIHNKMLNSAKKFQVMLVFSVGIFVVITGIVRIYLLNTLSFLSDP
jgi:ABC-type Mn2+/Zn2+ transport system permease subunit